MRKVFLILMMCVATPAFARGYYGNVEGKTFGIGLVLGDPTGLTAELKLGYHSAVDFALGIAEINHFNDDLWYFHIDYLLSPIDLASTGTVGVPIYLGIGGYLDGFTHSDSLGLGARVPLGLAIEWRTLPLQLFIELGIDFQLVQSNCNCSLPRLDLTGDGGFRIFF